jgi:hypothetical protein
MSRIGKLPINITWCIIARSQILLLKEFGTLQTKVPEVILLLKNQLKVIIRANT